jgi:hypothetical protein
MKLNLPDSVASMQDLLSLRAEARDYAKWYAHESIKKTFGTRKTSDQPELSPAADALLRAWKADHNFDRRTLDELVDELTKYIDSAQTLTITLAGPAPGSLRESLVAWCRGNVAPNVLVDFQFNSTLLGGMVVRFGSHIFDWSFRRQILDARAKFPEVLRRV